MDTLAKLHEAASLAKSPSDRAQIQKLFEAEEWRRVQRSPLYFFQHLAKTKNEHSTGVDDDPYQPFPDHPYVHEMVRLMENEDRLVVPKSRQVMMSWFCCAFALWWCLTKRAQLVLIQSKKEEDAGKLLERIYGIYERLPDYICEGNPVNQKSKPPELRFRGTDSAILGVPEGGHQVRSHTASLWISDEAAFQPEFAAAFIAAQPSLEGGGRAIIVSSAAPGRMYELVTDPVVEGSHEVLVPTWAKQDGLVSWKTTTGWTVARLHYSADPIKDQVWATEAAKKYGREGPLTKGWQAEMEIDPGANLGKLVYSEFSRKTHVIQHFTDESGEPSRLPPDDWPIFLGIDWGYRDPCACVFMALDGDRCWYIFDEVYVREKTPKVVARMIKRMLGDREPEGIFIGHDAAQRNAQGVTVQDLFADEHIFTETAYSKIPEKVATVSELTRLRTNGEPSLKVMERCSNTIYEFHNYRYPERTLEQLLKRDAGEKPQDKDDHAMDAMGNVVMNIPTSYARKWSGVGKRGFDLSTIPMAARKRTFSARREKSDGQAQYWDS